MPSRRDGDGTERRPGCHPTAGARARHRRPDRRAQAAEPLAGRTSRDALAHVQVEVTDHRGRLVPDATVEVAFDVTGAGELAGVASGNPHNVDSFRQPRRHTWHGRALAILRPAKRPGRLTLSATAPGLRRPRSPCR
ncbi:hypothetical protein [Streptomyces sp. CoH27]|uniref:hypothetical protein n=1 Tax=Streptomyces sp. CoH27 TaxID=2875763 RepID=UPI001CD28E4E|nr:hypothetical protein [Streptomyces sp. CoH27]